MTTECKSSVQAKEFAMETFLTVYAVVWLAISLYVARLSLQQRRLARRLKSIQQAPFDEREQRAKAA